MITGRQGSGKSTLSRSLIGGLVMCQRMATRVSFAETLYKMHDAIRAVLGEVGEDHFQGIDGPLLQILGTEWGRKTRDDGIWVRCFKARAANIWRADPSAVVVVDDCRFENELFCYTGEPDVFAIRIRLQADEDIRRERAAKWRENTSHASETGLDAVPDAAFDFVIDTSGPYSLGKVQEIVAKVNSTDR